MRLYEIRPRCGCLVLLERPAESVYCPAHDRTEAVFSEGWRQVEVDADGWGRWQTVQWLTGARRRAVADAIAGKPGAFVRARELAAMVAEAQADALRSIRQPT